MINLLIITHGDLGASLLKTARDICDCGEESAAALTAGSADFKTDLAAALARAHDGTVIMSDLFGGSTTNAAALLLADYPNTFLLTGVNLNMVFSFFHNRERLDLQELVTKIEEDARKGILNVNKVLK